MTRRDVAEEQEGPGLGRAHAAFSTQCQGSDDECEGLVEAIRDQVSVRKLNKLVRSKIATRLSASHRFLQHRKANACSPRTRVGVTKVSGYSQREPEVSFTTAGHHALAGVNGLVVLAL
jgi:hypothetical protein